MKPLKLKMQAFGSYGEETLIDFEKVNQNLFLITGDTGAGKTTIFDAIVFALYGEASSSANKKEGVVLQSQYVDFAKEPFVELTFSEGNNADSEIYTVRRVPRHLKPITRGAADYLFRAYGQVHQMVQPSYDGKSPELHVSVHDSGLI